MTPKHRDRPLVPYIRQSRAKERTISLDEQERSIRSWADANGIALTAPVIEQGVSGSKNWRERELGEVIARCERGEAQGVIVAFQDRLSREHGLSTAEVWTALEKAGARLVCAAEGLDTASGDHEMLFTIKAAIARDAWKRHRANWLNAQRNAIERGLHMGRTPLGYDRENGKLVPNEQAPLVAESFRLRAEGASLRDVQRYLDEHGVTVARSTVKRMFLTETYLGKVHHGEHEYAGEAHEPLVSKATFLAAKKRDGQKRVSRGAKGPTLLAGIVRCATCGRPMHRDSARSREAYRCSNAVCERRVTINMRALDSEAIEFAATFFRFVTDHPEVEHAEELREAEEALVEIEAEIEAFAESWAAEGVSPALAAKMAAGLESKKADAEARVAEVASKANPLDLSRLPEEIREDFLSADGKLHVRGASLANLLDESARMNPATAASANRWMRSMYDRIEVGPGTPGGHRPISERLTFMLTEDGEKMAKGVLANASRLVVPDAPDALREQVEAAV